MNDATLEFWNKYWGSEEKPANVGADCFGDTPDELAAMVVKGEKTATFEQRESKLTYFRPSHNTVRTGLVYGVSIYITVCTSK